MLEDKLLRNVDVRSRLGFNKPRKQASCERACVHVCACACVCREEDTDAITAVLGRDGISSSVATSTGHRLAVCLHLVCVPFLEGSGGMAVWLAAAALVLRTSYVTGARELFTERGAKGLCRGWEGDTEGTANDDSRLA